MAPWKLALISSVALCSVAAFAHAGGGLRDARAKAKLLSSGRVTPGTHGIREVDLGTGRVFFNDGSTGRFTARQYSNSEPEAIVEIITPTRNKRAFGTVRVFEVHGPEVRFKSTFTGFANGATRNNFSTRDLKHSDPIDGQEVHQTRLPDGRFGKKAEPATAE
jgi:hypothetical protein